MELEKDEIVSPKIRDSLISKGVITIDDQVTVAIHAKGPELDRFCLQINKGSFIWIDVALPDGKYYPVERLRGTLEACQAVIDKEKLSFLSAFPNMISPAYYVYTGLSSSKMLFQILMTALISLDPPFQKEGPLQVWQLLASIHNDLGRYLRALHSIILPLELTRKLVQKSPAIESVSSFLQFIPSEEHGFSKAEVQLREILSQYSFIMNGVSIAYTDYLQASNPVLLHGTFSAGTVIVSTDSNHRIVPVILGWLDVWYGQPAYDLGFLLGELLFLAACSRYMARGLENDILHVAKAFLQGYSCAGLTGLAPNFWSGIQGYMVFRVIDLLWRNSGYFGLAVKRVEVVLESVEALLPLWFVSLSMDANRNGDNR